MGQTMTEKKREKKAPIPEADKPKQGYLCCDTCGATCAYRGFSAPTEKDPWPLHRCRAGRISEVRPFSRFTLQDMSVKSKFEVG